MALSSFLRHRYDPLMQILAVFAAIALDDLPLADGSLVFRTFFDLYSSVHRETLASVSSDRFYSDHCHRSLLHLAHRWTALGRCQSLSLGELRLRDLFDRSTFPSVGRSNPHRSPCPFIHPSVSLQFRAGYLHLLQDLSTTSTPGIEIAHRARQCQTEEETSTFEEVSRPWNHLDSSLPIDVVTLHLLSQPLVLLSHLLQTDQRSRSR